VDEDSKDLLDLQVTRVSMACLDAMEGLAHLV